ncbi:protein mono-ADP-ribosyltransferase PARP12b [Cheilinus undulatus]|uniref:protein mono-ADP-ribosyltransferase PARP12b n=1 Tax=Cheilinus undulatus TaxID=241271 RepID=UPI001BD37408|nr:protein mono-ADP-ribosyltransferase PARP12b [Cheilinus undulatus]
MYDPEILEATRALCRAGGALNLRVLYQELLQRCNTNEEEFLHIMNGCSRFLLVPGSAGDGEGRPEDCTVVARTSLRLCSAYYHERCAEGVGCQQLHLCRYFIYGNCRFDKGRKSCKYSHDLGSDHNQQLLRECTLQELHEDHLRLLLLQNDPELLPEVCSHYNKGSAPLGDCSFQVSCTKIHLCQHFVKGDCMFGLRCKRQHTIDQHGRHMLEDRGLSGDLMEELPFIYRNMYNLKNADTEKNVEPVNEGGEEICLHFIRNSCKFNNECSRVHFHLPYKWEIFNDRTWTELQDMEDIERDFCDPSKNHSCTHLPVDFLSMRRGSKPVRRLSTISSVLKPPHYVLTTEWLWYYKGEQGNWIEYGHPDEKQRTTSVTSQTLEVSFQSNRTGVIEVVKGNRQYVLSFKDMYQRNPKHNTKRRVCRRPRFVPVVEVQRKWG